MIEKIFTLIFALPLLVLLIAQLVADTKQIHDFIFRKEEETKNQ